MASHRQLIDNSTTTTTPSRQLPDNFQTISQHSSLSSTLFRNKRKTTIIKPQHKYILPVFQIFNFKPSSIYKDFNIAYQHMHTHQSLAYSYLKRLLGNTISFEDKSTKHSLPKVPSIPFCIRKMIISPPCPTIELPIAPQKCMPVHKEHILVKDVVDKDDIEFDMNIDTVEVLTTVRNNEQLNTSPSHTKSLLHKRSSKSKTSMVPIPWKIKKCNHTTKRNIHNDNLKHSFTHQSKQLNNYQSMSVYKSSHSRHHKQSQKCEKIEIHGDILFLPRCYIYLLNREKFFFRFQEIKSNVDNNKTSVLLTKYVGDCVVDRENEHLIYTYDARVGFPLDVVAKDNAIKEPKITTLLESSEKDINPSLVLQKETPKKRSLSSCESNINEQNHLSKKQRNNLNRRKKRAQRNASLCLQEELLKTDVINCPLLGKTINLKSTSYVQKGLSSSKYITGKFSRVFVTKTNNKHSKNDIEHTKEFFLKHTKWSVHIDKLNCSKEISTASIRTLLEESSNQSSSEVTSSKHSVNIVGNNLILHYMTNCKESVEHYLQDKEDSDTNNSFDCIERDHSCTLSPTIPSKPHSKQSRLCLNDSVNYTNDPDSIINKLSSSSLTTSASYHQNSSVIDLDYSNIEIEILCNFHEMGNAREEFASVAGKNISRTTSYASTNAESIQKRYNIDERDCKDNHLVVLIPKEIHMKRNILSKNNISSVVGMRCVIDRVIAIQKKKEPYSIIGERKCNTSNKVTISGHELCTFYVGKNFYCSPHFQCGPKGLAKFRSDHNTIPCKVIKGNEDFIGSEGFPISIINTDSVKVGSSKGGCCSVIYNALGKIATNTEFLKSLISISSKTRVNSSGRNNVLKRGKVLQLHIGVSYSDCRSYKKLSLAGGTLPQLHGYKHLSNEVKKAILEYDSLIIGKILPTLGIDDAFLMSNANKFRKLFSKAVNKELGQNSDQHESTSNYITPAGGTFSLHPPTSSVSLMDALKIHVDALDDSEKGFNYSIVASGWYRLSQLTDSVVIDNMKLIGFTDWFLFTYIRYDRKCIGDIDKPSSSYNQRLDYHSSLDCIATKKVFDILTDTTKLSRDYRACISSFENYVHMFTCSLRNVSLDQCNPNGDDILKLKEKRSRSANACNNSDYRHGFVSTAKPSSIDKMCYYSSVIDIILSFVVQFRISYTESLHIVILFSIYCNGPSLFIQALESIMMKIYLGKPFQQIKDIQIQVNQNTKKDNTSLVVCISKQIQYEKWKTCCCKLPQQQHDINNIKTGSSTENRHSPHNFQLPHLSKASMTKFNKIVEITERLSTESWQCLFDKYISNPSVCSITKQMEIEISRLCQKYLKCVDESVKGISTFTAMTLLQVSSALGFFPHEMSCYGEVTGVNTGSYKFFDKHMNSDDIQHLSVKEKLILFNQKLVEITGNSKKYLGKDIDVRRVENLACEESRGRPKNDPIYFFGYRNTHAEHRQCCTSMQNFFIMNWNKKLKRMKLQMVKCTQKRHRMVLENVDKYVSICGLNKCITFKVEEMPYFDLSI